MPRDWSAKLSAGLCLFRHGINFADSWFYPWNEPSYLCTFSCKNWMYSMTSNKNDALSLFWSLWGIRSVNIWNLSFILLLLLCSVAECFERGVTAFWSLFFPSTYTVKSPLFEKVSFLRTNSSSSSSSSSWVPLAEADCIISMELWFYCPDGWEDERELKLLRWLEGDWDGRSDVHCPNFTAGSIPMGLSTAFSFPAFPFFTAVSSHNVKPLPV